MAKAKKSAATERYSVVNGRYRLAVGYRLTAGQKVAGAVFYLSKVSDDPKGTAADLKAAALRAAWAAGEGVVTISHEGRQVRVWEPKQEPTPTPIPPAALSPASGDGKALAADAGTIDAALPLYLETQRGKSQGHYVTTQFRLQFVAAQEIGGQRVGSMPLATYSEAALRATLAAVAARPLSRNGSNQPIAALTAHFAIQWWRYFLNWAHEQGRYTKPRTYERVWKDSAYTPKPTDAEEDAELKKRATSGDDGRYFPIEELGRLYVAADDHTRLLLLLCVNCGFNSQELNTLRRSQIEGLDTPTPYIHRKRGKTKIYAKWKYLFPELVPLLKAAVAAAEARGDEYVLRGNNGDRLVKFTVDAEGNPTGRYDYWAKMFDWAKKRAWAAYGRKDKDGKDTVRPLSAKYLRKSGARLIRHSGVANADGLASMYLSHTDGGGGNKVLKEYSERDWDALVPALKAMYAQLEPLLKAKRPVREVVRAENRKARYAAIMAKARAVKAERRAAREKEAVAV